jgi:pyruvate/2-oxoglutarate dehydrogenase complex dihydrolipoamide acyltransferase (E2) component
MAKRYVVRVREDHRWTRVRVSGREFTKSGEVMAEGHINEEMRNSPLLTIEEVDAPEPEAVDATSAARELAEEHGIDLTALVPGSGEEGRVLVGDVEEALDYDLD